MKSDSSEREATDRRLLRRIGLKIQQELHIQKKPVEKLAFEVGVARSTLREIIAGRSNLRILTLHLIATGLGYGGLIEFLSNLNSASVPGESTSGSEVS